MRLGTLLAATAVLCVCYSPLLYDSMHRRPAQGSATKAKPTGDAFAMAPTERGLSNPTPTKAVSASFAYAVSHPVKPLPDDVFESVVAPDAAPYAFDAADNIEHPTNIAFNPRVGAPRELSRNAACDAIVSVARGHNLPVPFFANLIWQESNFNPRDISRAGAQGIAQFMPQTAVDYGLINPFEPIHALNVAARFLNELHARFGNLGLAAAAYNAGPSRVSSWMANRSSLPGETRNYVLRITGRPASRWTEAGADSDPELALMPAKAPCAEVAEAVRDQEKVVRVAKLMKGLAEAANLFEQAAERDAAQAKEAQAKEAQAKEAQAKKADKADKSEKVKKPKGGAKVADAKPGDAKSDDAKSDRHAARPRVAEEAPRSSRNRGSRRHREERVSQESSRHHHTRQSRMASLR